MSTSKHCNKGTWTEEQDGLLARWQSKLGNKWSEIAKYIPGKNGQQCAQRWRHRVNPEIRKEKWTEEEDARLVKLVHRCNFAWAVVARQMPGRTDQQCMGRWRRHLDPGISRQGWSEEEDQLLTQLVQQHGHSWSAISTQLNGRIAQQCRSRWKQLSASKSQGGGGARTPRAALLASSATPGAPPVVKRLQYESETDDEYYDDEDSPGASPAKGRPRAAAAWVPPHPVQTGQGPRGGLAVVAAASPRAAVSPRAVAGSPSAAAACRAPSSSTAGTVDDYDETINNKLRRLSRLSVTKGAWDSEEDEEQYYSAAEETPIKAAVCSPFGFTPTRRARTPRMRPKQGPDSSGPSDGPTSSGGFRIRSVRRRCSFGSPERDGEDSSPGGLLEERNGYVGSEASPGGGGGAEEGRSRGMSEQQRMEEEEEGRLRELCRVSELVEMAERLEAAEHLGLYDTGFGRPGRRSPEEVNNAVGKGQDGRQGREEDGLAPSDQAQEEEEGAAARRGRGAGAGPDRVPSTAAGPSRILLMSTTPQAQRCRTFIAPDRAEVEHPKAQGQLAPPSAARTQDAIDLSSPPPRKAAPGDTNKKDVQANMPGSGGGTPFVSPDSNARWVMSSPGVPILSLLQTPNIGHKDGLNVSPGFTGLFTSPDWTRQRLSDSVTRPPRPRGQFSTRVQRRLLEETAAQQQDSVGTSSRVELSPSTLALSPAKRQRIVFDDASYGDAGVRSSLDSANLQLPQVASALRSSAQAAAAAAGGYACASGGSSGGGGRESAGRCYMQPTVESLAAASAAAVAGTAPASGNGGGACTAAEQPAVVGSTEKGDRRRGGEGGSCTSAAAALVQLGQTVVDCRSTEWLLRTRSALEPADSSDGNRPPSRSSGGEGGIGDCSARRPGSSSSSEKEGGPAGKARQRPRSARGGTSVAGQQRRAGDSGGSDGDGLSSSAVRLKLHSLLDGI